MASIQACRFWEDAIIKWGVIPDEVRVEMAGKAVAIKVTATLGKRHAAAHLDPEACLQVAYEGPSAYAALLAEELRGKSD